MVDVVHVEIFEDLRGGLEHLVDVVDLVGINFLREVHQRDLQRDGVLERHIRADLHDVSDLNAEHVEQLHFHRDHRGVPFDLLVTLMVRGESIDQRDDDGLDVHAGLELRARLQERIQRLQMELVGEHLDDALHEIFLRDGVAAADDLLEDARQDDLLVDLEVHRLQLGQTDKVGADEDLQLLALLLAARLLAGMSLVLHPHPQLVHLREVREDEVDGVVNVAALVDVLADRHIGENIAQRQQIVAEEQPAERILHSAAHLHEILQDAFLGGRVGLDVNQADGDEQIEPGNDVAGILHEFVEVGDLVTLLELVQQINFQKSEPEKSKNDEI